MQFIIMLLAGLFLVLANANAWFIIPNWCIWVCFGVAGVYALTSAINYFSVRNNINRVSRRF